MSTPTPVISDSPSYYKPESREGCRQPRPEPLGIVTARLIVAVRVAVARVGHVPFPFLVGSDGQIADCLKRSSE